VGGPRRRGAGALLTVDSHLHVWALERSRYSWLSPELGPLYATFTPEQARVELDAAGIGTAVLVQAEDSERDTELMLEAADRHGWIAGVVGWVQLDDPATAEQQLDRWQEHPRFRGVRHLVHDDPRDDFLLLPDVRRSLRLLAERGVPFDVPDAWPRHLAATADLGGAIDDLVIVVDHLGKPPFGGADWERWRATLGEVAERQNTVAKISGLQVPGRPFTATEARPAWEAALELFGPARLMWGSDWPLTVLTGGYGKSWETMSSLVSELSADEQAEILSGTATSVYELPPQ
jgi:L-fuconolactonase